MTTPRVVLTTAPESFQGLEALLDVGTMHFRRHPLQEVQPLPSELFDAAVSDTVRWDGYIVTSPRAAALLRDRRRQLGVMMPIRCFASGAATARAAEGPGVQVLSGSGGTAVQSAAEALALAIVGESIRGPLLHLAGDPHRPELAARLADAGIVVETLPVYRSVMVSDVEMLAVLSRSDLLVVGAPMVVRAVADTGEDALGLGYIAVGATTASACRAAGLPLLATAEQPTPHGVAAALGQALARF